MTDPAAPAPDEKWQSAVVSEIVARTPNIKSFIFDLPRPLTFIAGQHVDVRLTAPDGYRAMRSYSIASSPQSPGRIELAIERLNDGEVSPFFHDVVAVGDRIDIRGPLGGYFNWSIADGGPLLLIGGGSGVVPLVAMLRHRRASTSTVPALLLFSARTWGDAPFGDELAVMSDAKNGFELVLALTREAPRRAGDFGRRVDGSMMADILPRIPGTPQRVFVCGTNAFVDAAVDGALAAGLPSANVRTERYGA